VVLRGKGAGRYPTAEAVIGDLLEIARDARRTPVAAREQAEVA
jgi:homoserine dehydrogenase